MKRAVATELLEDTVPLLVLHVSENRLRELFPVELTDADEWSEPEPSKGALIRLRSGGHVLLMYGVVTGRATLSIPTSADAAGLLSALLDEIPVRPSEVEWVRDGERRALARKTTMVTSSSGGSSAIGKVVGTTRRISELRAKSVAELNAKERNLRKQLFKLRFHRATGGSGMDNVTKTRRLKRELAAIQAILAEQSKKREA
jgi:ribosomal protein L29